VKKEIKIPQRGIDRDKQREAIRKLGDEYFFYLLDDAAQRPD